MVAASASSIGLKAVVAQLHWGLGWIQVDFDVVPWLWLIRGGGTDSGGSGVAVGGSCRAADGDGGGTGAGGGAEADTDGVGVGVWVPSLLGAQSRSWAWLLFPMLLGSMQWFGVAMKSPQMLGLPPP